ncbi:hypothetical protein ACCO45_013049 [Purpureocillium lilacinum]|uniref:Uncharacterized protein n=1 Tax=Purpureocillium lilacinum TaxID=33203 RepID=A0ACC4DA41_PURLI
MPAEAAHAGDGALESASAEKSQVAALDVALPVADYEGKPTEEELATLRRVPGKLPTVAYLLCAVEFCERASYYGCAQIWTNYINRPLPKGGNGYGSVPEGSQATQGALGLGEQVANATSQSFSLIAYCLPLVVGYLADAKWAMFKPNVSPLLLDQMSVRVPRVVTLKSGERVIEDPEHSTERVMLWFYLLINIGAFMSTATSYSARYVGWWLAFLLPLILYIPLPFMLLWLKPRLVLHKPGGSDLPNVFRVIGHCMRGGGVWRIGRDGWWEAGKPSVIAASGRRPETHYNDQFVEDVKRTMQATGMFFFFPVQFWNDNGIGSSANFLSTMLIGNGVPNDVIGNFNSLSIIVLGPVLNVSATASLCYKAYQTNPCGWYGSTDPKCVEEGLVSPISLWWAAIPYALGGFSELFINVPAYGIAYSRASPNMRGLLSAINLFLSVGLAYVVNLAVSAVITDPHLVWDFGAPTILGAVVTVFFYFHFRHIDKEEYVLSDGDVSAQESSGSLDGGVDDHTAPVNKSTV